MKIILYCPQIPQNTGNIVRTCAVTGAELVLVRPLGFSTSDRMLKRAGLDYWKGVKVTFLDHLSDYLNSTTDPFFFMSSHSTVPYTEVVYPSNAILIFGSETAGLPDEFRSQWPNRFYTIPMRESLLHSPGNEETRCLNLSNAVSIVLYEALRQQSFIFG